MILDYVDKTGAFLLIVERQHKDAIPGLMEDHGLDFSVSASTEDRAVLFTKEPYAAVPFWNLATERAKAQLMGLQGQINSSWQKDSGAHIRQPADAPELWPFQKAGVEYALRRNNTIFGDQPGLGKTAQAICLANEMSAKRVLVLCPANIRLQWVKNIRTWTTMPWPYIVYPILRGASGVHPQANWTIVSYDLARTEGIGRALAACAEFDLLILDEGHYLKTIDSKRTQAIFGGGRALTHQPLMQRCAHAVALTGTPLPNRPREAYTLARGLCWDAIDWMSEDSFVDRFNPSIRREVDQEDGTKKFWIDERSGRHGELQARLRSNLMVRRMKHGPEGVMPQLKLPLYDIVYVEETGPVKQALAAESLLELDPDTLTVVGEEGKIDGHIAIVRHMMGVAIAPLAADYAAMCLDGGEDKIVIFAHHVDVLNILQERLSKYGVLRIDGSLSANQKQKRVDSFRTLPQFRVMIGNMQSMGTGTDGLQEVAWHAILAEADWVPGNNQQAVDRLDRGGQDWQVQADFLVAAGSISERVLASAIRKNQVTDKALDRIIT